MISIKKIIQSPLYSNVSLSAPSAAEITKKKTSVYDAIILPHLWRVSQLMLQSNAQKKKQRHIQVHNRSRLNGARPFRQRFKERKKERDRAHTGMYIGI